MLGQTGIRDEINKLVRYYFDAKEDYRLAAGRAPDPDLKDRLDHLCLQRERMHKEIQEIETNLNVEMSDNGHVSADFKRDWERLRGGIAGHGLEAAFELAHLADTRAVEQADRLTAAGLPEPLQATIHKHKAELEEAVKSLERWMRKEHQASA